MQTTAGGLRKKNDNNLLVIALLIIILILATFLILIVIILSLIYIVKKKRLKLFRTSDRNRRRRGRQIFNSENRNIYEDISFRLAEISREQFQCYNNYLEGGGEGGDGAGVGTLNRHDEVDEPVAVKIEPMELEIDPNFASTSSYVSNLNSITMAINEQMQFERQNHNDNDIDNDKENKNKMEMEIEIKKEK